MKQSIARKHLFVWFFLSLAFLVVAGTVRSDDREENIDVFLVLDKSLSMVRNTAGVIEYINETIVRDLVIPGDRLVIITFYGEAQKLTSVEVTEDVSEIVTAVRSIRPDGRFTDIGNALDVLKATVSLEGTEGRRKHLMLITDGIQEAPPGSKYYSIGGELNHAFLENARQIAMEGWKVHILGIGAETAARAVAEELSGTYSEVPESPRKEDLDEQTQGFLNVVEQVGDVIIEAVAASGRTSVELTLRSVGYRQPRDIVIANVEVALNGLSVGDALESLQTITIAPGETKRISLPIKLPGGLSPGRYDGHIRFVFAGQTPFTPAAFDVAITYRSFIGTNIWIIPVGLLLLLLIAALIVAAAKGAFAGGKLSFVCEIEDGPVRKHRYTVKFAETLYLVDGVMGLNVVEEPGVTPAAELRADKSGLHMNLVGSKTQPIGSVPENVLGQDVRLRKSDGKKAKLSFRTAYS